MPSATGATSPRARSPRRSDNERPIERIHREVVSINKPVVPSKPMQIVGPPSKKKKDDDYDDDFEDYNDDFETFEEEDKPPLPVILAASKRPSFVEKIVSPRVYDDDSKKAKDVLSNLRKSVTAKISSPDKIDSHKRGTIESKSSPVQSERKSTKEYSGMNMSTAGDINADPRARRLNMLRKILDLEVEVFPEQLKLQPISKLDMYKRQLRAAHPIITESSVSLRDDRKDAEVNTDEIEVCDKEMQFTEGDETAFLNIIRVIHERKNNKEQKYDQTVLEEAVTAQKSTRRSSMTERDRISNDISSSTATSTNSVSLTSFLEKSSTLCLSIIEESHTLKNEKNKKSTRHDEKIFSSENKWTYLSEDSASSASSKQRDIKEDPDVLGIRAFVGFRPTVALRFSRIQPHILITAHPFPLEDTGDFLPSSVSDPLLSWLCTGCSTRFEFYVSRSIHFIKIFSLRNSFHFL